MTVSSFPILSLMTHLYFAVCFSHIGFLDILWTYCNVIFSCICTFVLTIFSVWNIPLSPSLPVNLYSFTRPSSNVHWVLWSFKLSEYLLPLCHYIIIFVPSKKYLPHYVIHVFSIRLWVHWWSGICLHLFFTQYLVDLSLEMLMDTCLFCTAVLHNV